MQARYTCTANIFLTQTVIMVSCDWGTTQESARTVQRGVWRSVLITSLVQCVMTSGTDLTPQWCAGRSVNMNVSKPAPKKCMVCPTLFQQHPLYIITCIHINLLKLGNISVHFPLIQTFRIQLVCFHFLQCQNCVYTCCKSTNFPILSVCLIMSIEGSVLFSYPQLVSH